MRNFFLLGFLLSVFSLPAQFGVQSRMLSTGIPECWKTVEIGMVLPEQERSFRMFLDDRSRGQNPYTSGFLWMQFSCNGKTYLRPAFYMEDGKPDLAQNKFITEQSEWPWRVRFSPPDTGMYECVVLMGEDPAQAQPLPTGIQFHVERGNRHGILHTTPGQPRLSFTDGTPFFILGQNICWCDTILKGRPVPDLHPVYQSGYYDWYHYLHNLADNGGNYVRIVMGPWATGIEWEEVGVYRQDKAFALDSVIKLAEERGLYVQLCVDLTTGFAWDNGKNFWHPIRRAYQREGMTATDLLKDSAALVAFDNYIRYVHSRWAYSANVAVIELMGEQDRWEGYETRQKNFYDYFVHARAFLDSTLHDPYHMLGTSVGQQHVDVYRNPALSFVDVHHYDNNFWCNRKRYFIYHQRSVEKYEKPFLFGEIGIINGPVNGCDPDDWDYCSDISMHNALWSTTFMGGMGNGLYWWQWNNDGYREANYKPLRYFIDSVANKMTSYSDADQWDDNGLEAYYCRSRSGYSAVGWVHNTSYWWANTIDSCKDRHGNTMLHPRDDDKADDPVDRKGNTFVVKDLKPRMRYNVRFYDTRNPQTEIEWITVKSTPLGRVRLHYPGGADCAFEISVVPGTHF